MSIRERRSVILRQLHQIHRSCNILYIESAIVCIGEVGIGIIIYSDPGSRIAAHSGQQDLLTVFEGEHRSCSAFLIDRNCRLDPFSDEYIFLSQCSVAAGSILDYQELILAIGYLIRPALAALIDIESLSVMSCNVVPIVRLGIHRVILSKKRDPNAGDIRCGSDHDRLVNSVFVFICFNSGL